MNEKPQPNWKALEQSDPERSREVTKIFSQLTHGVISLTSRVLHFIQGEMSVEEFQATQQEEQSEGP